MPSQFTLALVRIVKKNIREWSVLTIGKQGFLTKPTTIVEQFLATSFALNEVLL